ncbi:MAG: histidine kinase [Rikenellaceae bacterium]|nr:histidine kinase [Rikenellaceae bacterium]
MLASLLDGTILFVVYVGIMLFNIRVLVPCWLQRNHYLSYIWRASVLILGATAWNILVEYLILRYISVEPGIYSYFHPDRPFALVLVTEFCALAICLAGTTLPFLLRQWIMDASRKNNLEKTTLQYQSEEIRNRVNPSLLLGVLDAAAGCTRSEPEKSSDLLIRLSRFLRYQLYDRSRKWVFLNSEIGFLDNYLRLESSRRPLQYLLRQADEPPRIPVSPMLFFQVVRSMIEALPPEPKEVCIELLFESGASFISMTGTVNTLLRLDTGTRERIRSRLEILYSGNYRLSYRQTEDHFQIEFQIPIRG